MASSLPPDPWKILGVDKAADKSDIRAAYKKLVLKCHPDKVQDPTLKAKKQEEFQKVQQAYELLNDDTERAKYEQKQKLADLQRAAAKVQQEARNSPNTSVPRTSTRYATFDIRTAEPTSRYTSSPSGGKVYTHYTTTHTRSHEEVPSSRVYTLYDETDKQARRTASYEKPSRKDEERRDRDREERKRRKEDEEFNRIREKDRAYERERDKERERAKAEYEKEKEREARKAEKKRLDKERERERRRETEDKARRHKPYVEPYADAYADAYLDELWLEDEKYVSARSDKKRSSSRKHEETREREKSSSRRAKSPHLNPDSLDRKGRDNQSYAAAYIMLSKSQTSQSSYLPHPAPTPPPAPPVDFVEDDSLRHAAARAAGRRSSNDAARSREKLRTYELDPATPTSTTPKSARPIPTLKQSYSTPPNAPESPPRVSRSQTVPHDLYARPIPSLQRNQTWAAGSGGGLAGMEDRRAADYYDDYDSDDDRDRRHRRSGRDRRARSPSAQVAAVQAAAAAATQRYKVEGVKTSKLDPYPSVYGGTGESPTSRRYAANAAAPAAAGGLSPGVVGVMEGGMSPSATATYQGTPFRVKEAKTYGPADVKYSEYGQPSYYYSSHGGEGYPVVA